MNIKTSKNSISILVKGLLSVGSLAIILLASNTANAYVPGVWDPTPRVNPNEPAFFVVPTTVDQPVVVSKPAPTQVQQAPVATQTQTAPVQTNSQTQVVARAPATKTVARSTTTRTRTVALASNTPVYYQQQPVVYQQPVYANNQSQLPPAQTINPNYNPGFQPNMQASAAKSGSFFPTTFWGWFLLILLILAVIMIARKLIKSDRAQMQMSHAH